MSETSTGFHIIPGASCFLTPAGISRWLQVTAAEQPFNEGVASAEVRDAWLSRDSRSRQLVPGSSL